MFWDIFLKSLALIVIIMVFGQLIASFVENKDKKESADKE